VSGLARNIARRLRRLARVNVAESPGLIPIGEDPAELFPGLYDDDGIRLARCGWRFGHIYNDQALIFLCHLAAHGAAPIVEFGTFDGRTTYNLALNVQRGSTRGAAGVKVVTIDAHIPDDLSNADKRAYGEFVPGQRFLDAEPEIRSRIEFILSDSRHVDLSDLNGQCGLVIVDGGHSHDVCASDTRKALELVRPGGVIVWDDYTPYWPGVKDTLDALSSHLRLTHFPRLGIVVHINPR
jgi:predicted O-methyltransferase YrrM